MEEENVPLAILTFTTVIFQTPVSGAATTASMVQSKNTKRTACEQKTPLVGQFHVRIPTAAAMFVVGFGRSPVEGAVNATSDASKDLRKCWRQINRSIFVVQ